MISFLLESSAVLDRTIFNFALFALLGLVLLFEVFAEKSKWVNNTAESKKAIIIIASIAFAIFICLYIFYYFG